MRELKFRAWDTENDKMVYDPYFFDVYHFSDENRVNQKTYRYYEDWRDLEDGRGWECELMQYVGLKDKKGKEIYEGDVVEYKSYSVFKRWWSDTKEIPVIEAECEAQRQDIQIVRNAVEFIDGGFMLGYHLTMRDVSRGQKFERGQSSHGDTESKEWDFEVIGNIYENPNLLK